MTTWRDFEVADVTVPGLRYLNDLYAADGPNPTLASRLISQRPPTRMRTVLHQNASKADLTDFENGGVYPPRGAFLEWVTAALAEAPPADRFVMSQLVNANRPGDYHDEARRDDSYRWIEGNWYHVARFDPADPMRSLRGVEAGLGLFFFSVIARSNRFDHLREVIERYDFCITDAFDFEGYALGDAP